MKTITAASRTLALAALLPAVAWAGPREDVMASIDKFTAARSWHATMEHVSPGKRMRNEMDFAAPDRYRLRVDGVGEQVLVGDTVYMHVQGRSMKLPMPKGTLTRWREPARMAENLESMTVTALGAETVDGEPARKYRLDYSKPRPTSMTLWIGANGYPVQALTSGSASGEKVTTTIRYSRFNDPSIRIAAP